MVATTVELDYPLGLCVTRTPISLLSYHPRLRAEVLKVKKKLSRTLGVKGDTSQAGKA